MACLLLVIKGKQGGDMSNVHHINESGPYFETNSSQAGKAKPSGKFENALSQALGPKEGKSEGVGPASGLTEITSAEPGLVNPSERVSGKTDQLLEKLDAYSNQLEDPSIPLKSIAPALEKIKDDAGSLEKELNALAPEDDSLKQIASQTVITAQTEYLKFQRGDYLP